VKWHSRYLTTGDLRHINRALRDLCEAVWDRAPFVGRVDTGRPHWSEFANNYGVALLDAYKGSKNVRELDDAVVWLRQALEKTPSDSPLRTKVLANLITAVRARSDVSVDEVELPDLVALNRELSLAESARVEDRLAAAASWGYAAAAQDPAEGLVGLDTAVELLPRAAWWGQTRESREEVLASYTGLAADAAACAVEAGQPGRALELLEGGRAVMWTQVLKTRTDRVALRLVAPRLAKRMDRVAIALERDMGMSTDKRMALVSRWAKMDNEAQAKLLREWESLTARADEALPEGTFTIPSYGPDLRPAGEEGPVVIVNVSEFGCSALIVHDQDEDEPQVVALPDLTYADAQTRASQYVTALSSEGESREQVVNDTLEWLGQSITSPVLAALDLRDPNDDSWSRVWWCPTGPLMTLPLHAAMLEHAVSSYTPTLRVLIRARERWERAQHEITLDRRLLHVIVGDDLPGLARTREYIEERLPAERRTTLDGDAVTPPLVAAELGQHAWVHFDCHGVQDLDHPFQGGLVLRGQRLTVADVAGTRHDQAEFAFLAACKTATGGTRIPDESITLAVALQYAGYQNVIGTLWTVPDRSADRVARSMYGALIHDGRIVPTMSAQALHNAIRAERDRMPRHPSAWVPFLHVGL
jgi:CHAT domain-containing protein